ncbi:hypothetical protein ACP275_11G060900 [Erythranthe tilingii]
MEKKSNTKKQVRRPRDHAYEQYELEHMPHALVVLDNSVPSDRANKRPSSLHESSSGPHRNNETVVKQNIDVEAEAFIALEHRRFERERWMSINK